MIQKSKKKLLEQKTYGNKYLQIILKVVIHSYVLKILQIEQIQIVMLDILDQVIFVQKYSKIQVQIFIQLKLG